MTRKPTVPEVLPLVNRIYESSGAGCCLHVVLDDGNLENESVMWSKNHAITQQHELCIRVGRLLRRMSVKQRIELCKRIVRIG